MNSSAAAWAERAEVIVGEEEILGEGGWEEDWEEGGGWGMGMEAEGAGEGVGAGAGAGEGVNAAGEAA